MCKRFLSAMVVMVAIVVILLLALYLIDNENELYPDNGLSQDLIVESGSLQISKVLIHDDLNKIDVTFSSNNLDTYYVICGTQETLEGYDGLLPDRLYRLESVNGKSVLMEITFSGSEHNANIAGKLGLANGIRNESATESKNWFEREMYVKNVNFEFRNRVRLNDSKKAMAFKYADGYVNDMEYRIYLFSDLDELKRDIVVSKLMINWDWNMVPIDLL